MPHVATRSYHNNRVLIGNYIEERNAADFDAQQTAKKLASGQSEPLTPMQVTQRRVAAATSKVQITRRKKQLKRFQVSHFASYFGQNSTFKLKQGFSSFFLFIFACVLG